MYRFSNCTKSHHSKVLSTKITQGPGGKIVCCQCAVWLIFISFVFLISTQAKHMTIVTLVLVTNQLPSLLQHRLLQFCGTYRRYMHLPEEHIMGMLLICADQTRFIGVS